VGAHDKCSSASAALAPDPASQSHLSKHSLTVRQSATLASMVSRAMVCNSTSYCPKHPWKKENGKSLLDVTIEFSI
jgi:hypothetical protein